MLFLFRGKNGPLVRVIIGAVLVIVGIILHGWLILAGIGAVLLIWGAIALLSAQRTQRRNRLESAAHKP
jgi:Flp pilus assembly protein TadB